MHTSVTLAPRHSQQADNNVAAPSDFPVNIADILMQYLTQLGIEYVFGIPGGAIEPLFSALAKSGRQGGIRHILARHAAGAAFMADGYARETGKIGVCCATSGPGAINLLGGVACAYANNIPLLVITGQPALPTNGKHLLQDPSGNGINILNMFQACTRYNSLVNHPQQFESKLVAALQCATRSPRGPVHLSFPFDIFGSDSGLKKPSYDLRMLLAPTFLVDKASIASLRKILSHAKKTVVLIGNGCGDAIDAILHFIALEGALFVTTPDGKGLVSPSHPQFRGVFGFGGHVQANMALADSSVDLIIAVGVNLCECNSDGWNIDLLNEKLVHIDESGENLAQTPMARLHVHGAIKSVFTHLIKHALTHTQVRPAQHSDGATIVAAARKYDGNTTPLKPQRLMRELGALFPPTTRFLADSGNSISWAIHYLNPLDRRRGERRIDNNRQYSAARRKSDGGWLRLTMHFAPMGWAIGAAIGTAAANQKVPIVCITGDGSMLMNGLELSVAVAEKLTVIFVVLNDRALGMVKQGQQLSKAEQFGYTLPATDFAMMARAMGAVGHTIKSPHDLHQLDIAAICARQGPTLLDVLIDPEEVPPINTRIRVFINDFEKTDQ